MSAKTIEESPWIEQLWGKGASEFLWDIDEVPEPDWLVEGMVVRQGLTLIYGESQVGKTTFCLYLIDALDEGKPLFGRKCKKAKVLFIEQDQSPPITRGQKRKLGKPEKLAVVKLQIKWNNTKKEFEPSLGAVLTLKPDVVIIDAYTSLGVEDINHPSAGLTFDALRVLSQEYNCAFVLIHHTNKSGTQMGSGLNVAKMDSVIFLAKKGQDSEGVIKIEVRQGKIKGDNCEDIELTFDTNTLKMTTKETTKDMVFRLKDECKTDEEVKSEVTEAKPASVERYLRAWAKEHEGGSGFSGSLIRIGAGMGNPPQI
jgi:RecA-family ATPase